MTLIQYFFRCLLGLGRNPLPLNGAIGARITSDGHLGAYRSLHRRSNGQQKAKAVQMNQDARADRINILRRSSLQFSTLGVSVLCTFRIPDSAFATQDRGTCCSQYLPSPDRKKIPCSSLTKSIHNPSAVTRSTMLIQHPRLELNRPADRSIRNVLDTILTTTQRT